VDRSFFSFVTTHALDRQTAFSSLVRAGIPCSAVKSKTERVFKYFVKPLTSQLHLLRTLTQ